MITTVIMSKQECCAVTLSMRHGDVMSVKMSVEGRRIHVVANVQVEKTVDAM